MKREIFYTGFCIGLGIGIVIGIAAGIATESRKTVRCDTVSASATNTSPIVEAPIEVVRWDEAAEPDAEPAEPADEEPGFVSLGEFTVTAYCGCVECCGKSDRITATGTNAEQGRTVAVDPEIIPYGSLVIVDGMAYIAEDTLAQSVKDFYDGRIVDIYFETHEAAVNYGKQTHEVWVFRQ